MHSPSHSRFQDQLLRYAQEPDAQARQRIDAALWAEFGVEQAVLVLDMSGFSQLTLRFGVVHYLSMVRRMQLTVLPIVFENGGQLVKFEADNCFAMFPDVQGAVRSAFAMNRAFAQANSATADELDIKIACGIDFGWILLIDGSDFFGHPVNRASKLGEDLAAAGEILVTREAMLRMDNCADLQLQEVNFTISGIELQAFQVRQAPCAR